ncbi:MAG: hypothetical protein V3U26_02345 [Dehalococcoidia bacterium]
MAENAIDAKSVERRNLLKAMGIGLGSVLALGGVAGWLRYLSGSKNRPGFLFRRRAYRPGLPSEDSIFYPRDPEVRERMVDRGRGA